MILASLNDYYYSLLCRDEADICPFGYSMEKASYAIVLNQNGGVVDVNDIRDVSAKKPVPKRMAVPQIETRGNGIRRAFFGIKLATHWALAQLANAPCRNTRRSARFIAKRLQMKLTQGYERCRCSCSHGAKSDLNATRFTSICSTQALSSDSTDSNIIFMIRLPPSTFGQN